MKTERKITTPNALNFPIEHNNQKQTPRFVHALGISCVFVPSLCW